MDFLANYGLFLLKTVTIVIGIIAVIGFSARMARKARPVSRERLKVKSLNEKYKSMERALKNNILPEHELKQLAKTEKKEDKAKRKQEKKKPEEKDPKKRVFILKFEGDILASSVKSLREEITALLTVCREKDEVVLKLESSGGAVHSYGLAAAQLLRLKNKNIPLTVAVDKIAASGGYKMACVADRLVAAPFAIVGSIGVVWQQPNFHRLLKKNDIDYDLITAGKFKRTLTMLGENTPEGREKQVEQLEDIHLMFKEFVKENRDNVNIEKAATGEYWYGTRALEMNLIDELKTSDDLLLEKSKEADLYEVTYKFPDPLSARISYSLNRVFRNLVYSLWQTLEDGRHR